MKRYIPLVVLIVALLIVPASLLGCGDMNESKSALEKADEFMSTVDETLESASQDVEEFADSLKKGTQLTAQLLQQTYDTLKAEARKLVKQVQEARAENEKILSKEGSSAYKKYIEVQNQILDNVVDMTNTLTSLFSNLASATEALRTGSALDGTALAATAADLSEELEKLKKEGTALKEKAGDLKKELGL